MRQTPFLIDSHTHIQFSAYDEDRERVIEKALAENIWLVNAGSNSVTSEAAVKLAEKYKEGVYATIGIHPSHASSDSDGSDSGKEIEEDSGTEDFNEKKMMRLSASPKVVAVGECGLEYYRNYDASSQQKLFLKHVIFADKIKKPLVIHCREAYGDVFDILSENEGILNNRGGLMHFFSGTADKAKKFLDIGFYFSFGGAITFPSKKNGADFEELIKLLPIEKILVETDAPYVSPVPFRGQRNDPVYIKEVAKRIAEIKKISLEKTALATTENAMRLFAIGGQKD